MTKDVDPAHIPSSSVRPWLPSAGQSARRLVVIGDVHGHIMELRKLLEKIGFDRTAGDHLILVGDLINKGPDSAAVVQLAMDLGADAVRGNNEDRVLLASATMKSNQASTASIEHLSPKASSSPATGTFIKNNANRVDDKLGRTPVGQISISATPNDSPGFEASDVTTAASLSDSQLAWISSLPLILRIGQLDGATDPPWNAGMILVVHAGLVPGVSLEKQSPWAIMNMRSLTHPSHDSQLSPMLEESVDEIKQKSYESGLKSEAPVGEACWLPKENTPVENLKNNYQKYQYERLPLEGREGEAWSYAWNVYQNSLESASDRVAVIYGHDALTGLQVEPEVELERLRDQPNLPVKGTRYAFGLDSGCVYGKELTALVLGVDPQTNKIGHRIERVKSVGVVA